MAVKVTEVSTAATMEDGAYVLVTQQENGVEVLRRVPEQVIAQKIASLLDEGNTYVKPEEIQRMYPDLLKSVERVEDNLVFTYWNGDITTIPVAADSGLSFDAISMDDGGYLHITMDGEDVVDPCYIGNRSSGGGGGSSFHSGGGFSGRSGKF